MAINKTVAGTFVVDFRDQFKKRMRKTFETHKEAVRFEKEVAAQVQSGDFLRPSDKTVKEVATEWHQKKVDAGTYRRATLESWKNHVDNYIVATWGEIKAQDLDVERIERGSASWVPKLSPKSVNKVLTTLTAILGMAKRYKVVRD